MKAIGVSWRPAHAIYALISKQAAKYRHEAEAIEHGILRSVKAKCHHIISAISSPEMVCASYCESMKIMGEQISVLYDGKKPLIKALAYEITALGSEA